MKVYVDSSTKKACFVFEGQEPITVPYPEPVTVNVGEYKAVIAALGEAVRRQLGHVDLFTDSQLVVEQVKGNWKCCKMHLLPLRDYARTLLRLVEGTIQWIPREENIAGKVLG